MDGQRSGTVELEASDGIDGNASRSVMAARVTRASGFSPIFPAHPNYPHKHELTRDCFYVHAYVHLFD